LNLTNKFAKGKDIKESVDVFVLFCSYHTNTIRQFYRKSKLFPLHNSTFIFDQLCWRWLRCTQKVFCVRAVRLGKNIA
jgi:hypothetical protein